MNETGRHSTPGQPGADSWADETLPLGLRKELLDRELRKFIAGKNRGQSATPRRGEEQGRNADRPASGKRAGDRSR